MPLGPDQEAAARAQEADAVDIAPFSPVEEIRAEGSDRDLGGDGVSAGGGYDPVAAARADRAVIAQEVTAITVNLMQLSLALNHDESPDELRAAGQVQADAAQLLQIADEMLSRGAGQGPDLALAGTATAAAVKREVKSARKHWLSQAWGKVWNHVKAILPHLWSMIAHLVKVQTWTVQGQAGVPVLNLASVSISVTFGP